MFGDFEKKQEELQQVLDDIEVTHSHNGITIIANGNQLIKDIVIPQALIDKGDVEELQDMLLVAINETLEISAQEAEQESQNLLNDMLSGMGGLMGGMA